MMEKKLMEVAAALPEPAVKWENILMQEHKTMPTGKSRRMRPAFVALSIVVVLSLSVVAYAGYKSNKGMTVINRYSTLVFPTENAWERSQKMLREVDLVMPEVLSGTPFEEGYQLTLVPHDTSYLDALLADEFRTVNLHYSIVEFTDEYGNFDRHRYLDVSAASIKQPFWKHFYEVDENGGFYPEATHVEHYRGIELRGKSRMVDDPEVGGQFVIHSVQWVDYEKELCFSISVARTDSVEFLMECAKEIIDLNHAGE